MENKELFFLYKGQFQIFFLKFQAFLRANEKVKLIKVLKFIAWGDVKVKSLNTNLYRFWINNLI